MPQIKSGHVHLFEKLVRTHVFTCKRKLVYTTRNIMPWLRVK